MVVKSMILGSVAMISYVLSVAICQQLNGTSEQFYMGVATAVVAVPLISWFSWRVVEW